MLGALAHVDDGNSRWRAARDVWCQSCRNFADHAPGGEEDRRNVTDKCQTVTIEMWPREPSSPNREGSDEESKPTEPSIVPPISVLIVEGV